MKQKIQIILYRNNVSSFSNNLKINSTKSTPSIRRRNKKPNKFEKNSVLRNHVHKNERITFERSKTHIFV